MSRGNSTLSKAQLAAMDRARSIVNWAKRRGAIRPPTDFACVDCGKPALVYDHRDYNKPLDVDPVCNSCNVKRGAGKPVDLLHPVKHATGYIVDATGVHPVYFQAVDFDDQPTEPTLSELPSYTVELEKHVAQSGPLEAPQTPQVWSVWR